MDTAAVMLTAFCLSSAFLIAFGAAASASAGAGVTAATPFVASHSLLFASSSILAELCKRPKPLDQIVDLGLDVPALWALGLALAAPSLPPWLPPAPAATLGGGGLRRTPPFSGASILTPMFPMPSISLPCIVLTALSA